MGEKETIVLSLGGSLIVPNGGIDIHFLIEFSKFVRNQIAAHNRRFFIICGGGATARNYIEAGSRVVGKTITFDDKDWLGIHSTRLNAHLVRTVFRDIAYPRIFKHYDRQYDIKDEPVVVCSGWKPGWSTDFCAVLVAEGQGSKTVVNLSNIDKVYDKDPRKYKDAKAIDKMSWDNFEKLVGNKWIPGLNAPFDPVATQKAKTLGLNVIILNGKNIKNLENAIDGEKFVGTVIAPLTLDAAFYDREYFRGSKGEYGKKIFRNAVPLRSLYRALLIKLVFNPKTVLDVGCGLGYTVHFLRMLGVDARGLEISEYALESALSAVKPFLKQGDIRSIPYKENSFDLVVTVDVLEHIHQDDLPGAIDECTRVSKKRILHKIYTTENWLLRHLHGTDLSHVSVLDVARWENLWKEHELKLKPCWWPRLPGALDTSFLLEK